MIASRFRVSLRSVVVVVVVAFVANVLPAAALAEPPRVPDSDAHRHVGKVVTVCGHVEDTAWMERVRGRPTFLNLGGTYPQHTFTVVIWDDVRGRFETAPHVKFAGADICVTGLVETYKGKPQIIVRDPDKLTITGAPVFPAERFSPEERIVLKAVLSALGFRADAAEPDWNEEASGALRAFQESAGLTGGGERDASTLRKLAEAAAALPGEEATRILQLLLLNLAQRET
ncbi:MAG TPA: hypothetical protein VKU85_07660 [bacterium]|nr:hypothetical protein [bacterium]